MSNTGGPAYPSPRWEGWGSPQEGMTLRDYFAAKAMQGLLVEPDYFNIVAKAAYEMADEMLKVRIKESQ
jgi:hypothetical protein